MSEVTTADVIVIFRTYIALKLHFNSEKYIYRDGFRSDKITENSMNARKDVNTFISVTEKYLHKHDEFKETMISLFKKSPDTWIGDVLEKPAQTLYKKRMANIFNLTNLIEKDAEAVSDYMFVNKLTIEEMTIIHNNDRPIIVKSLRLSDEFLALLDFVQPYLLQPTDNPLWKKRCFILHKYKYMVPTENKALCIIEEKLITR